MRNNPGQLATLHCQSSSCHWPSCTLVMGDNTAPEIVDTVTDEEQKDPIEDEKYEMPDEESKPEIEKPKECVHV